ncbi:3-isopropylmalate dehydratase [Calorimonas adulescens]|uniref:3-isopropylmalate dehydratase small subunit n=1 Tax=Calorimonas adulescens TaxID=2606906 RepID=A0A5D8QA82_9THEO|nr:3-isopropylmalate dehydratase [Calorimonas adulescens]TZE81510.1 3-isopropylmalate dehydratase [Calorimonas adulescens]
MIFKGRTFTFGDNIDTDVIIPTKYLVTNSPDELKAHCMEGIDTEFAKDVCSNDIIVAGENFGCGSSREHAVLAISGCGVRLIIAKSFARIFFRNCLNRGIYPLEFKHTDQIDRGNIIFVDTDRGILKNETKNEEYEIPKFDAFITELIELGGIIPYARKQLNIR